jgi:hypothetical protein
MSLEVRRKILHGVPLYAMLFYLRPNDNNIISTSFPLRLSCLRDALVMTTLQVN